MTAAGFFSVGVVIGLSIFLPLYFELVLGIFAERLGHRADRVPRRRDRGLVRRRAADDAGSTHYKRVPLGGLVLGIVMLAVFALAARPGCRCSRSCVLLTVGGAGLGVMYPVTTTIVQNAVAPHQLGIATGALNFCAAARRRDHRRGVRRASCWAASTPAGAG